MTGVEPPMCSGREEEHLGGGARTDDTLCAEGGRECGGEGDRRSERSGWHCTWPQAGAVTTA